VLLLIAGACPPELERALEPVFRLPFVRRLAYGTPEEFRTAAHAVDACANLRYPAAAETSGIAIRLMGACKPVIATESEEISRYPEEACVRVPSGPGEVDAVAHVLAWLRKYPADAEGIGRHAAEHIAREHNPERVAELYWRALRQ
jgi:hypothetical protein